MDAKTAYELEVSLARDMTLMANASKSPGKHADAATAWAKAWHSAICAHLQREASEARFMLEVHRKSSEAQFSIN